MLRVSALDTSNLPETLHRFDESRLHGDDEITTLAVFAIDWSEPPKRETE